MNIVRNDQTTIMHRSVIYNGVVYFGGVVGEDLSKGMYGQTISITERLDALLKAAGTNKTKLLSANIFITDMGLKDDMSKAWTNWIAKDDLPTRATIGVADLGPNCLIEVVITAAV